MSQIFASSSVVLVNNIGSTIVYCSALSSIGNFLTVRDNTGRFRSTNAIFVSSLSGAIIEGNVGPLKIIDPFGFVTLNPTIGSKFTLGNTFAFPLGQQTANVNEIKADNITVTSTLQMLNIGNQSTNNLFISSQTLIFNNGPVGGLTADDLFSTVDGLGSAGYISSILVPPRVVLPPLWLAGGWSSNTRRSIPVGQTSTVVGTLQYSFDGFNWSNANGGFNVKCTGIAYGNGVYVAVGENWGPGGYFSPSAGFHQWSLDGRNWNFAVTPTNFQAQYQRIGCTFNNGLFHSFGTAPYGCTETIMWSRDGSNWYPSPSCPFPSPFGLAAWCSGVAYGAGVWVASGLTPTSTRPQDGMYWSTDGSNWNSATSVVWNTFVSGGPAYTQVNGVSYDGTKFIATCQQGTNASSSNICYSYDGKNWTSAGISNGNWNNRTYTIGMSGSNGIIVNKLANARVLTTTNAGFNWSNNTNLASCNVFGGENDQPYPYYDGTKWYLGIEQNAGNTSTSPNFFYSYNLSNWTNSNISTSFILGGFPIAFCYTPGSDNYIQALYSTNRTVGPVYNASTIQAGEISTSIIRSATANISSVFAGFTSTNTTIEFINNITNQFIQNLSAGVILATEGRISSLSAIYISTDILRIDSTVVANVNQPFLIAENVITNLLNVCTIRTKLGLQAGAFNQGSNTVAIGAYAGQNNQGENAIAVGFEAATYDQDSNSIAIGYRAGYSNQSSNAVAIGFLAGPSNQSTNTIVLNASGFSLFTTRSNAFYVSPVRQNSATDNYSNSLKILQYDSNTKEIYYGNSFTSTFSTLFVSTVSVGGAAATNYNFDMSGVAQFSTVGSVYFGLEQAANGVSLTWNGVQGAQGNTEFISMKGPTSQDGFFNFYTGVNNNTNPGGSNLTFTIGSTFLGINISTPQVEVDVYDRVHVNSTISTPALFLSSLNGYRYNSTITTFSTFTASSIFVSISTIASSTFTNSLDATILFANGQTTLRYPPKQQLWVAAGTGGSAAANIKYSTDGLTWTNSVNGGFSPNSGIGIAWNGNLWIAVGQASGVNSIRYSTDGSNWNNAASGAFNSVGQGIAWNGRMWVATGGSAGTNSNIQYSFNGSNWSNISSGDFSSQGWGVTWNGTRWMAVGTGASTAASIKYSYDGSNWSNSSSGGFSSAGRGIGWNGYMWVALGSGASTAASIQYSYDGLNWSNSQNGGFSLGGYSVAWNGSIWVAVGSDPTDAVTIQYSYDGINWSNSSSGGFSSYGLGIAWNGRLWVATGAGGAGGNIKYSYDGRNWTNVTSGAFSGDGFNVSYSYTLNPDMQMNNLNVYSQSQPTYLSSVNQILTTASTIVINNTLYVDQNSNHVGINRGFTEFTVDVLGNIRATSTIIATDGVYDNAGFYTTSDSNLKESIAFADLNKCYETVKNIPLRRYTFANDYIHTKSDKYQLGFIAQEVQKTFPHAVIPFYNRNRQEDILHLNHDQLFMAQYGTTKILIEEMRRQSTLMEQLNYYVKHLEEQISSIKLN